MPVTREQVEHIARLARLSLNEAEVERLTREFNQILAFVEQLGELDTQGIPPTAYLEGRPTPLREDVIQTCSQIAELEALGPKMEKGFYVVPRVIED